MAENRDGRPARPATGARLNAYTGKDWRILALSGAGSIFIILGLMTLALPSTYEGMLVLGLGPEHALRMMDIAGMFSAGIGVILTWLSGMLWQRQMQF